MVARSGSTYIAAVSAMAIGSSITSVAALLVIESPVRARSVHGDMAAAQPGGASPASRRASSRANANPPPAELPTTAMDEAGVPVPTSHR